MAIFEFLLALFDPFLAPIIPHLRGGGFYPSFPHIFMAYFFPLFQGNNTTLFLVYFGYYFWYFGVFIPILSEFFGSGGGYDGLRSPTIFSLCWVRPHFWSFCCTIFRSKIFIHNCIKCYFPHLFSLIFGAYIQVKGLIPLSLNMSHIYLYTYTYHTLFYTYILHIACPWHVWKAQYFSMSLIIFFACFSPYTCTSICFLHIYCR